MNGAGAALLRLGLRPIGREYTMAIAFGLGASAYWLLGTFGATPWRSSSSPALIFFTWGEIFSLFPSTCTDMFGPRYATANTSLLYTAKGTSAFLVPLANVLKALTGSWHAAFSWPRLVANFAVVVLALFVLKPMRAGTIVDKQAPASPIRRDGEGNGLAKRPFVAPKPPTRKPGEPD